MAQLKAIIFDVDGTLANTEEIHRQAFNAAFTEFGLEYSWSEQEYTQLLSISGGKERIYAFLKEKNTTPNNEHSLREYSLVIHKRKSEIYREKLIAGHIGLRNGVERLLNEAASVGVRLAIATCTSISNVETLLKNALGPDALLRFDAIVTSDIVIDKKPSPVVYQFALAELGLRPSDCIAIEDTHNGNLAALETGLKTVITTHPLTLDNNFTGASLILDQLGEPNNPFTVSAGNAYGATCVDIRLLEKISLKKYISSVTEQLESQLVVAIK
jgi:HAD superfamily hydrolase (TIGR01509 family)